MWINIITLFLTAMVGGLLAYRLKLARQRALPLVLTFAGAYLFAITLVHVLPELFGITRSPFLMGVLVLAGFYMQQILEYFTQGAEHGHLHPTGADHHHHSGMALSLMFGLSVHAFLEGTLLGHSVELALASPWPLLAGIALHKMPAAFAMMTVLLCRYKRGPWPLVWLFVFAVASPAGVWFSDTAHLPQQVAEALFALVSGSFLHISTTIVFEGSPQHQFSLQRLAVSLLGAMLAVAAQWLLG